MGVLDESYLINTNMTRFIWFSKIQLRFIEMAEKKLWDASSALNVCCLTLMLPVANFSYTKWC